MKPRWILVGGDTLLGKEVRDLCQEHKLPVALVPVGTVSQARVLTVGEDDEASVMEPLTADVFDDAAALLLAGDAAANRAALDLHASLANPIPVIDFSGTMYQAPGAVLRAPLIEAGPVNAIALHVIAHPAAVALARILLYLHRLSPVRSVVASVFEPASSRGREGVEELHQQTASLFSFQTLTKTVFDAQAAFNLLPRLGESAPSPLSSSEHLIAAHLRMLARPHGLPIPSIRLIQAPVFHGYCQSLWFEFEARPTVAAIEARLKEEGLDIRAADLDPASNVAIAGQSGMIVSDIADDPANPHATWLFIASDNLRTIADNAILVSAMFLQTGGRA